MRQASLMKISAGALAVVISVGMGLANSAQAQTLTIYSGRSKKLIGPLIEKAKKDLGFDIQVRYGKTAELAIALLEEGRNSRADLFFAQDAGALGAVEQKQLTLKIPSPLLNKVDTRFRSPQGHWLGISARARTVDYNTKLVNKSDLPQSIWDLTKPKWRGKVGWAPTNGSFQSFVTAMRVLSGEQKTLQWLRAMKANGVKSYPKNTPIVAALGRGEIHLGLVNHYYLQRFKKDNPNFPVAHHYTRKDPGAMINVAGVATMKTTDQKKDVEALINYLLKPVSQNYFAQKTREYPLTAGVSASAKQMPLKELNPPNINLSKLSDLEKTLELLQKSGAL